MDVRIIIRRALAILRVPQALPAVGFLAASGYTPDNPLELSLAYPPEHYGAETADIFEVLKEQLSGVQLDYVVFNEDMAYKTASMISPQHIREFMLPHYRRIADAVAPRQGETVITKTYPSSFEKTNLDAELQRTLDESERRASKAKENPMTRETQEMLQALGYLAPGHVAVGAQRGQIEPQE